MAGGLPDYLDHGLRLVIVGERPGDESLAAGQYYFSSRNHFWLLLSQSGLLGKERFERGVDGNETRLVCEFRIGLTDAYADPEALREKIRRYKPTVVAFNGMGAAALAGAGWPCGYGRYDDYEDAASFVVPNSSGADTHMTRKEKSEWWRKLAAFVDAKCKGQ